MSSQHFFHRTSAIVVGSTLMLLSASAAAAPRATNTLPDPYRIPTANPSNIGQIRDVTGDALQGWEGEIHQDLSERAVCGGWDMTDTVQGKIPVVSGVPGRKGNPLGNITSGMASRDESTGALGDGFLFPNVNQVQGWSTACQAGFPPYLDDGPPCKDPANSNYGTPQKCESLCPRINAWQYPIWVRAWVKFDPITLLPIDTQLCVQNGKGEASMNRSPMDGDCCERNGSGDGGPACGSTYGSDTSNPRHDPYPGSMPPDAECLATGAALESDGYIRVFHTFSGWFYCCTGAIVTKLGYAACSMSSPAECVNHPDARRNCVRCEGDGLPTGQIHPAAGTSCASVSACPGGFICQGLVPEFESSLSCADAADCYGQSPCVPGDTCRPWVCNSGQCEHPVIPGVCALASGVPATIDYNGDLIPRGLSPLREEIGCRAGYGATANGSAMSPGRFISYFREYTAASYSRNPVNEAANDIRSRSGIPVACYGFYDEFDPKTRATTAADARCVIAAYQSNNEFRLFYKTQLGHGSFGQTSAYPDPNPTATTEIRDPSFDDDEDLWYQNLGGAFSLLNGKKFKETGQDMTFALLSLDSTLERARGPMLSSAGSSASTATSAGSSSSTRGPDPFDSLRSPGALRRAFDDTVSNERGPSRTITEWWQKQETAMQDMVHPAVAHIVFPSAWSANLNLQHHFPSPSLPEPVTAPVAQGDYDPRMLTIEVQTEVRDDLLGEVASFLEEALIAPVEERSIAIVVPFGSATDFRAYKEAWIRWKEMREEIGVAIPPETQPLIDRLEEYAVQIDQSRALRAELAKSLGAALNRQGAAVQAVHDWLEENLDDFREFQEERQLREQLLYRWRNMQATYRDFHDKTNMPWCKNDTFTTPIYSLLDSWMLGRPDLSGQALPQISYPRPEDVYIDLSAFQTEQVPLIIPVLKPVQILVSHDTLGPPFVFQEEVSIPTLPPLPPLPDVSEIAAKIPVLTASNRVRIPFPDVSLVSNAYSQCMETTGDASYCGALHGSSDPLISMEKLVNGMNAKYKQFWDAVTKPRCGTPEAVKRCTGADPAAGDCCVKPGEETYCRRGWNSDTCVHVEMDLVERFTRIGARPAVLLLEDFLVTGSWRSASNSTSEFPPCDPRDWACLNLHAIREEPKYGWDAKTSTSSAEGAVDALRGRMFEETLQTTGSSSSRFPYQANPGTIVPSFDVRKPIDLSPITSSAPAASSAASTGP